MTRPANPRRQGARGFTLVEVLISLLIFSLIATSTIYTLRIGVTAREQLAESDDRLRAFQALRLLLKDDLAQILPRGTRDEFGNPLSRGFQGGQTANARNFDSDSVVLLRFVRHGWTNPDYVDPRPSIQRVEYVSENGTLIRRVYPFADEASDQPVRQRVMMRGLSEISANFLVSFDRGEAQWTDRWPVDEDLNNQEAETSAPPAALSLRFSHDRYGALTQDFWINAGGEVTP
ncbi:MAG: type II secretion system minor pseudopilin GspJ [Pseudomonadota bacterium]